MLIDASHLREVRQRQRDIRYRRTCELVGDELFDVLNEVDDQLSFGELTCMTQDQVKGVELLLRGYVEWMSDIVARVDDELRRRATDPGGFA